jgi:uroporphyrin-III C-methyltransferase
LTKKRGVREFWVITEQLRHEKSTDVALAAQSSATVVLMGMSKLNEIVAIFQKRPKEKPLRLFKTEPPEEK